MNKLLLLVIVIVVMIGAFMLVRNKKQTQAPVTQSTEPSVTAPAKSETESQLITLTSTGFTPKDVVVKAGTRITWKNDSGETATVNSAVHPTHSLFPILNLGEFNNGSSLQVVLTEKGAYKYHNHLNASETGTITVE